MNIGVDAREIQDGVVTGIGRSLKNFIEYFKLNDDENNLILFAEKKIPIDLKFNITQIQIRPTQVFIWDQVKLTFAIKSHRIDLFYSPYYKVPILTNIPIVNQILDLMYLVFPDYKQGLSLQRKLYYATIGRAFALRSCSIITDSEHAKQDIVRIWKINPEKIVVIPLGVASCYKPVKDSHLHSRVRQKYNLPQKYILYLGNFKPHKNVLSLIEAFIKINCIMPEYKLVLAGPLDKHGRKLQKKVAEEGIETDVIFTGMIRESDSPEVLLSMADLFIFPSLYEGFGLPPLEAMACRTAVIASNKTSIPEVVGDAAVLVNPLKTGELENAIVDLLTEPGKRDTYAQKGLERSRLFQEDRTAGKIYQHLTNVIREKR
jgi:glycosyltransferase involved in cell wall biosynthesis